ncbi:peptide deformylase [Mogibacterium pumilum]|uniref:Peptide deformylase n=1 Tax=Mogibacterium pumilum TaxID=86332 RepID=A0A223ASY3_9FIRM|nr:peptide deformylase [Mogibacterium pumilum]ASS38063.1 peptide deformylase [Mogibacterium pumilum]
MALRKIVIRGDEILTKQCKPVTKITDRIRLLCEDMLETMKEADGVGLAAPQVGVMKRLFVCRPELENFDQEYVMINPEIIETEGEQESAEGCLSVPGYIGLLKRPERVKLKAMDLDGEIKEYDFSGFAATCIMHENDHLNGIVYPDIAEEVYTTEQYNEMMAEVVAENEEGEN